jgi:hypothetical protein
VDGDQKALRVEAVHLDQAVIVRRPPVDDEEDVIIVGLELCALAEILRVLDRQWMELERLPEDLEVRIVGLLEVEPEELAGTQVLLDRRAVDGLDRVSVTLDERRAQNQRFFPRRASPCFGLCLNLLFARISAKSNGHLCCLVQGRVTRCSAPLPTEAMKYCRYWQR